MAIGPVVRLSSRRAGPGSLSRTAFDMGAEDVVGIVVDEVHLRAGFDPFPRGADDERRLAAFGDGEDRVWAATPRSPICFLPNAVKSSKPSTALMRAKSPPAITLSRAILPLGGGRRARQPRATWRCQKSRQNRDELNAQPARRATAVKKSRPPRRRRRPPRPRSQRASGFHECPYAAQHVVVDVEEQAAARQPCRGGRVAELGGHRVHPSVVSAPSLNWLAMPGNSSERACEVRSFADECSLGCLGDGRWRSARAAGRG